MYCTNCGQQNDDSANNCSNCGQALNSGQPAATPPAPPAPPAPVAPPAPPAPPAYGAPAPAPMPAAAGYAAPKPPRPSNWLWQSIVATLLCCWPLGIPGIVFAVQVGSKYDAGDYAGAEAAAKKAKLFTLLSIGLGFVGGLIYVVLMVILGIADSGTY